MVVAALMLAKKQVEVTMFSAGIQSVDGFDPSLLINDRATYD